MDMIRDSARSFLSSLDHRKRVRALQVAEAEFEPAVWRQMAELGWFGMLVSEDEGGMGMGIAEVCTVSAEIGRALMPEPFVDAAVQPSSLLSRLPPNSLRDELLSKLISGSLVIGVAWQEGVALLNVGPSTACTRIGSGEWALNGVKHFVRPGPESNGWIVPARYGTDLHLVWVEAGARGLTVTTATGIDGRPMTTLRFAATPALVVGSGTKAEEALNAAIETARIAQAAELTGIARQSLELTRDYLTTRVQFGKPIGSFQALQHRLVDGLIQVELAEACLREVANSLTDSTLPASASRAKARCAHAATEMARLAIQLHGAIGTTNECDIGLYFKRAMTLASRWGNAAAHRKRYAGLVQPPIGNRAPTAPQRREIFPTDLDWASMPEVDFRQMVRELFATHYPEHRRFMPYRQTWAESRDWYMTLSRLGWIAPAWPKAHGGLGLPADKLIAYIEETEAWGVARAPDQGLVMVGPILMRFGTDAQRQSFLPPILAGEHIWTQGYSEPNAGSDLASLRTEAIADGDHFIVSGQKTWTTWGADGTHMFMLVRTDKTAKKQAGISFLLVDLKTPGITVRPIENIAGEREFCEVFFDNVRVPCSNLVGEINQGWTIAKALLGFERLFTGSPKHSQHTLHQVTRLASQMGLANDPVFADRIVQLQLDTTDLASAYADYAELAKRGEPIPPGISMLKIWSTETYERLALLLIDMAGDYGCLRDHCRGDEIDLHVVAPLFNAIGAKIFAGSNEIQRNILAKTVLGLPS